MASFRNRIIDLAKANASAAPPKWIVPSQNIDLSLRKISRPVPAAVPPPRPDLALSTCDLLRLSQKSSKNTSKYIVHIILCWPRNLRKPFSEHFWSKYLNKKSNCLSAKMSETTLHIVRKKQLRFLVGFFGFGIFLGRIFGILRGFWGPYLEDLWEYFSWFLI